MTPQIHPWKLTWTWHFNFLIFNRKLRLQIVGFSIVMLFFGGAPAFLQFETISRTAIKTEAASTFFTAILAGVIFAYAALGGAENVGVLGMMVGIIMYGAPLSSILIAQPLTCVSSFCLQIYIERAAGRWVIGCVLHQKVRGNCNSSTIAPIQFIPSVTFLWMTHWTFQVIRVAFWRRRKPNVSFLPFND